MESGKSLLTPTKKWTTEPSRVHRNLQINRHKLGKLLVYQGKCNVHQIKTWVFFSTWTNLATLL